MPSSRSAMKRVKQNEKCRLANKARKSKIITLEKAFRAKLDEKDFDGAAEALKLASAALDKAAKVGVIHDNKVDRKKSRLAKALVAAKGAA